MRIRQIKPEWWTDAILRSLSADVREFYIGLWMQADDDGYFRWDVSKMGAELYPFGKVHQREAFIARAVIQLADTGHVVMLECNLHGMVPKMMRHQIVAATRRVVRTHGEHNVQCVAMERDRDTFGKGKERDGTERDGMRAHAHEGASQSSIDVALALVADPNTSEPARKAAIKALDQAGVKHD